jgi:CII-binding regulator of phage lambda lysogenization HflD
MAILTFLAIAAGTWAIGKVVDYVWTKGEKALGIESQEEKDAKRDSAEAKAMLDSVAKFRSSMKKGLGGIEQGLSRETESLLKLDKVLNDSGQTMSQLMSSITFLDNLVDQHANKAENIQQVVKDEAAVIRESMKKFKSDLVHLNDVEKEVLFKVSDLAAIRCTL